MDVVFVLGVRIQIQRKIATTSLQKLNDISYALDSLCSRLVSYLDSWLVDFEMDFSQTRKVDYCLQQGFARHKSVRAYQVVDYYCRTVAIEEIFISLSAIFRP